MAENSKIEWTDHTVNLWWGCQKVHTGCKNCYAENLSKRFLNDIWGENKHRKLIKSAFKDLYKYQRQAKKENKKVKVFIGSMMDIFENSKPILNKELLTTGLIREKLFVEIEKGLFNNIILIKMEKKYLQKKLKHTNFDGIIHYGKNGEKQIDLIDLLRDYKKQLRLGGVGNWLRFEDEKPVIGQHYLLVWETYPPEKRIWQKEDIDKNWDILRWLPIPKWN